MHNAWVKVSPGGDPLWPDIQLLFVGASIAQDFGIFTPAAYNLDAYVSVFVSSRRIRVHMHRLSPCSLVFYSLTLRRRFLSLILWAPFMQGFYNSIFIYQTQSLDFK